MSDIAPWKAISDHKRKERDAQIPREYILCESDLHELATKLDLNFISKSTHYFTQQEIEIINKDAPDIIHKTTTGKWTTQEVTEAFIKAAMVAHQLTNCLTEIPIQEARSLAKSLDASKHHGPLHGLPISLKDTFNIYPSKYSTSLGFTAWAEPQIPPPEECVLVTMLRSLGAVVGYVKTNVPTAMMMVETENHLWGRTRSPFNKNLSPGGSSGGEAVLLAMRGSPLGIGTDIGGSIRIPASWNNLYSLKPSFGRFPTHGARSGMPGQETIKSINGPMATSLAAIQYFCKALVDAEPWRYDSLCLPIPWRESQLPSGRKLRIGVFKHDGVVRCHPPVERAVDIVRRTLEGSGMAEVFAWEPRDHKKAAALIAKLFIADGASHISEVLNSTKEPWYQFMRPYEQASRNPEANLRTSNMWDLQFQRTKMRKEYLDRWNAASQDGMPMDAIICPVSPWCGIRQGASGRMPYVGYTCVWNFHDYSAATLPVTFADKEIDQWDTTYKPLSKLDKEVWEDYDAELYHGGPAGVQVVCRVLEEEKCLQIVQFVSELIARSGGN